jgi:hypothetical protein
VPRLATLRYSFAAALRRLIKRQGKVFFVARRPFSLLTIAALLSSLLVLSLATATVSVAAPNAKDAKAGKLGLHDTELLAAARAKGEPTVTLLIASTPGRNNNVASAVQALGGTIRYKDDGLGYLRAVVATNQAERVAALAGVDAVDLDEIIPLDDPRPENIVPVIPQTPPSSTTPRNNAYMPIGDIRAAQFTAAHPTWDGRGITIGIVDTGVSLDHPSLLTTSTGERKVVGWVTGTSPLDGGDAVDPTWINMAEQVNVVGGSFTTTGATGASYTGVAANGTYRFGSFFEGHPRFGGAPGSEFSIDCDPRPPDGPPPANQRVLLGGDLNRNGVCNERFAVLWRVSDNMVWVDTNADRNFTGAAAMTDYNVNFDIGGFGTDNSATAVREVVPFVIQTDGKNKFVNIGIVSGAHASHVTGIAAGNAFFGGQMSGAAPGAKIVSSRACLFVTGCTSHALLEGMIDLVKHMNVDVVNMSIGGLPALNDANNARARVYDRLIEQSNVQMFISAGNSGPGINTAGDPAVATRVMAVGASITQASYLSNYGADPVYADNLLYFSSRGPREDGGFKPEIVAPGSAVSSTPLWQPGSPVPGTYTLPPGYSMFNGTSMAAPQATGGAALLLSAAKQAGVQHQPAQLRQAINSTARRFTDAARFQAYDQGNGLMNVEEAWNALRTNIKTVDITSAVPVNTILAGFFATPGVGVGIHDREGVTVGTSYTRTYTFRRTSGGGGTTRYNLTWVGNDGTFSSANTLALPKGAAVTLAVTINPTTAGAHSAILNVDDPATVGIDYQTMNAVFAPYEFTSPSFSQEISSTIERAQTKHYFFRVPVGTPALKVDFSGPSLTAGTGAARFLRWHPWGLGIDSNAVSNCYAGQPGGTCFVGNVASSPTSRTTTNPQAGVWEVTVDARRNSDATSAPFTLTTSILGATVSPNPDVIASATVNTPINREYTLTNLFGAFTGRAVGTDLGSARRGRFNIDNLEQQFYEVTVPTGATSLRATIGNPSDPAADLDLFVYNCTTATSTGTSITGCTLAGQNADGDSEESVTINNPAAGRWVVFVDGFAVPAGNTDYNYIDVFFTASPSQQGTIVITDANALRPAGSSWTVTGTITAKVVPATGRVLYGNVQVRTDTNVLIGSGDVIIESVTAAP